MVAYLFPPYVIGVLSPGTHNLLKALKICLKVNFSYVLILS